MAKTLKSYTQGNLFRHLVTMTLASSVGLIAIFSVDFLDLIYIKSLGVTETAAAVGFSGNILFYTTSIGIGISIAMGVLVSRAIGAQDIEDAKKKASSIYILGGLVSSLLAAFLWILAPYLLDLLGAQGETRSYAITYLRILLPSVPFLVTAMAASSILRAAGDAKRSMYGTLSGGIANAILDPIFIFDKPFSALGIDASIGFGWGLEGAAIASFIARIVMMLVALHGASIIHGIWARFDFQFTKKILGAISVIALPAMLTNIATPIGDSFVTQAIARYGDSAVSGVAIIGRIIPISFAVIFSLSGAVGPIIGQNLGAKAFDRVQKTIFYSLLFTSIYVLCISLIMFFSQNFIIEKLFNSTGEEADLVHFFLTFIIFSYFFNGALFVANATFNNLGYAAYATLCNFTKVTLGTLPFIYVGARIADAKGVLAGQALGTALVSILSITLALRLVHNISSGKTKTRKAKLRFTFWKTPNPSRRGNTPLM